MRAILLCAALAVAALGLAACGDGEADSDAPTRAQFIAQTDARCKTSNRRTRTLNQQLSRAAAGAGNEKDLLRRLAPILERGYPRLSENAKAFRAVDPPADDATEIARISRLYDQQAEFVRKLAEAAERRDVSRFTTLTNQQQALVTRTRRMARAYGFRECGSSKSDPA